VDKIEVNNMSHYVLKEHRFQLDKNIGIYNHLVSMYNEFVKESGKILVSGEEIIQGKEIELLMATSINPKFH
jgi:hypothetical protein